jgi:hypothetical protein
MIKCTRYCCNLYTSCILCLRIKIGLANAGTLLACPFLSVAINFQNSLFRTGARSQSSIAFNRRLSRYTLVPYDIVAVKILIGTTFKSTCKGNFIGIAHYPCLRVGTFIHLIANRGISFDFLLKS